MRDFFFSETVLYVLWDSLLSHEAEQVYFYSCGLFYIYTQVKVVTTWRVTMY